MRKIRSLAGWTVVFIAAAAVSDTCDSGAVAWHAQQ
jgi:hypothetical protein